MKEECGGRGKKSAKFWASPLRGAPPLPSGPHPFLRGPPLRGALPPTPTKRAPPLRDAHGQWARTLVKFAQPRSLGAQQRGPRGLHHQTRKETLGRPDHILLSVDLASPPVTVDFRSSRNLRGNCTCSNRSCSLENCSSICSEQRSGGRSRDVWTGRRWLSRRLTSTLQKPFVEEVQGGCRRTQQVSQKAHPDPSWQYMESFHSQSSFDGIPSTRSGKEEATAEQRHGGPDHREGGSGQSGGTLAAAGATGGALLLHRRGKHAVGAINGRTQMQIHFCMFFWLGLCCVPLGLTNQIRHSCHRKNKHTLLNLQRT